MESFVILSHVQLVSAFIAKGGSVKVREKALVQMRSWQETEKSLGSWFRQAPEQLKTACSKNGAESLVNVSVKKGWVLSQKRNFPIREAAVACLATKDEFKDGRFIGPICHPVKNTVITQNMSLCDLLFLPFECSSLLHTWPPGVRCPYSALHKRCGTPKSSRDSWWGFLKGNKLAGQPITAYAAQINKVTHPNREEAAPCRVQQLSSWCSHYLVGTTPKGLSIFRNGNARC